MDEHLAKLRYILPENGRIHGLSRSHVAGVGGRSGRQPSAAERCAGNAGAAAFRFDHRVRSMRWDWRVEQLQPTNSQSQNRSGTNLRENTAMLPNSKFSQIKGMCPPVPGAFECYARELRVVEVAPTIDNRS